MARTTAPIGAALLGVALVTLFPSTAGAQQSTEATFKVAVQVPGAVLPPGVYQFTLSRDRKTVSISDSKRRIVTTVRVIEVSRQRNGPRVTMRPAVEGAPPEVEALYSTGSTRGVEFIYSQSQQ
jgi:hypothetical protein